MYLYVYSCQLQCMCLDLNAFELTNLLASILTNTCTCAVHTLALTSHETRYITKSSAVNLVLVFYFLKLNLFLYIFLPCFATIFLE